MISTRKLFPAAETGPLIPVVNTYPPSWSGRGAFRGRAIEEAIAGVGEDGGFTMRKQQSRQPAVI